MSLTYNVCFLYLSDVKHIISLRIHAVFLLTLTDTFTAFNPTWTHHERFSSSDPYNGSSDTRHAKSGLHVVSRDVKTSSILAFHYCYIPGYKLHINKFHKGPRGHEHTQASRVLVRRDVGSFLSIPVKRRRKAAHVPKSVPKQRNVLLLNQGKIVRSSSLSECEDSSVSSSHSDHSECN